MAHAIKYNYLTEERISGALFYPLSNDEATALPPDVRAFSGGAWWLRTSVPSDDYYWMVWFDRGRNGSSRVDLECAIRPAILLDLKKVTFSSETQTFTVKPPHAHSFSYSANGATIIATCTADDCDLDDGSEQHLHTVSMSIAAPTLTIEGGSGNARASMTGALDFLGVIPSSLTSELKYYNATKNGNAYIKQGNALASAPTAAGHYLVECSLQTWSGTKRATASLGYTIAREGIPSVAVNDIAAPVATAALDTAATTDTEHVTLNNEGAITWDPAAPLDGNAAYATTYKATVTLTPEKNYAFTNNVTATVNGNAATVTKNNDGTLAVSYTFAKTALNPVTIAAVNKEVIYSSDGIAIPVDGMFTIPEGAGEATWSVENGTGTGTFAEGKLTVTTCRTFTVKVSTAASDTHEAGAEVSATLTVNKDSSLADSSQGVAGKTLTHTAQPQPLVTAGEVEGGKLYYALSTNSVTPPEGSEANPPVAGWSEEIPTGTDPGTYYVWYLVKGDANHNDVAPTCVVVTIENPAETTQDLVDPSAETPTETSQDLVQTPTDASQNPGDTPAETPQNPVVETPAETPVETPAETPQAPVEPQKDYTLLMSMKTSGKKAFKLSWTKVPGAEGYDIYFGLSGGKYKLQATTSDRSYKISKLKKGTAYKAYVVAWKTVNGEKAYIGEHSPEVRAIAGGKSNKYTNPKKISVKKKKLTLTVGKTGKIKASVKKVSDSRRFLNQVGAKVRYFSSDRSVATVDAEGKVTAVGSGSCKVYAVAENGLRVGVTVTVK